MNTQSIPALANQKKKSLADVQELAYWVYSHGEREGTYYFANVYSDMVDSTASFSVYEPTQNPDAPAESLSWAVTVDMQGDWQSFLYYMVVDKLKELYGYEAMSESPKRIEDKNTGDFIICLLHESKDWTMKTEDVRQCVNYALGLGHCDFAQCGLAVADVLIHGWATHDSDGESLRLLRFFEMKHEGTPVLLSLAREAIERLGLEAANC